MTFDYFVNPKTIAYLLSFVAIMTHAVFVKFIMVKKDFKWIIMTLVVWAIFNLTVESDGLFFNQMKGAKNIIKISLAAYFILASTCMYFVLCSISQYYHKVQEKNETKSLLREYGRANYNSDEEQSEEEEEEENESAEATPQGTATILFDTKVEDVDGNGEGIRENLINVKIQN